MRSLGQEPLLAARALYTARLLKGATINSTFDPKGAAEEENPYSIDVGFADMRDAQDFYAILLEIRAQAQKEE